MRSETIARTCTVAQDGQTTLPMAVREILGIPEGGRIRVKTDGARVVLERLEDPVESAAAGPHAAFLPRDPVAARHTETIPGDILAALRDAHDARPDHEVDVRPIAEIRL